MCLPRTSNGLVTYPDKVRNELTPQLVCNRRVRCPRWVGTTLATGTHHTTQSAPRATRCSPAHCVNAKQICIVEVNGFTQLVLAPSRYQVLCNLAGSICEPHGSCVKLVKPK